MHIKKMNKWTHNESKDLASNRIGIDHILFVLVWCHADLESCNLFDSVLFLPAFYGINIEHDNLIIEHL